MTYGAMTPRIGLTVARSALGQQDIALCDVASWLEEAERIVGCGEAVGERAVVAASARGP